MIGKEVDLMSIEREKKNIRKRRGIKVYPEKIHVGRKFDRRVVESGVERLRVMNQPVMVIVATSDITHFCAASFIHKNEDLVQRVFTRMINVAERFAR